MARRSTTRAAAPRSSSAAFSWSAEAKGGQPPPTEGSFARPRQSDDFRRTTLGFRRLLWLLAKMEAALLAAFVKVGRLGPATGWMPLGRCFGDLLAADLMTPTDVPAAKR